MKPHNRKLLGGDAFTTTQPPLPPLHPINSTSTNEKQLKPNSPLDSSVALTVLILLVAIFFMAFFSLYIRRLSSSESSSSRRRLRRRSPPPQPPHGLAPSTVRDLPILSYHAGAKQPTVIDCPICLTEFEDLETVKMIPFCGHVFHPQCIETWLVSKNTCPLCRSTRLFPAKERSEVAMEEVSRAVTVSM